MNNYYFDVSQLPDGSIGFFNRVFKVEYRKLERFYNLVKECSKLLLDISANPILYDIPKMKCSVDLLYTLPTIKLITKTVKIADNLDLITKQSIMLFPDLFQKCATHLNYFRLINVQLKEINTDGDEELIYSIVSFHNSLYKIKTFVNNNIKKFNINLLSPMEKSLYDGYGVL